MYKPTLIALLFVAVVSMAAATPTIFRKSSVIPEVPKQPVDDNKVVYTTTITAEQAEIMRKNLERATYDQANQHLADIVRKK